MRISKLILKCQSSGSVSLCLAVRLMLQLRDLQASGFLCSCLVFLPIFSPNATSSSAVINSVFQCWSQWSSSLPVIESASLFELFHASLSLCPVHNLVNETVTVVLPSKTWSWINIRVPKCSPNPIPTPKPNPTHNFSIKA